MLYEQLWAQADKFTGISWKKAFSYKSSRLKSSVSDQWIRNISVAHCCKYSPILPRGHTPNLSCAWYTSWAGIRFYFAYPILKKLHCLLVKTIFSWNWVHRKGINSTEYWNLSFFIPAATIRSVILIWYNVMFTMVTAIPCAKWKKLRWVSR